MELSINTTTGVKSHISPSITERIHKGSFQGNASAHNHLWNLHVTNLDELDTKIETRNWTMVIIQNEYSMS